MAAYLNTRLAICLALGAVAVSGPGIGSAQPLVDPTRPAVSAKAGDDTAPVSNGAPELQSVLISPQRKVAVINGETVKTGDMVGGARVIAIHESEVILRTEAGVRVLRMYPEIEKKTAAASTRARDGKHKK